MVHRKTETLLRLSSLVSFAAFAACTLVYLANPLAAHADVLVFSNFGTNNAYGSGADFSIVGQNAQEKQRVAMRFTAANSVSSITSLSVALTPYASTNFGLTLGLYADNNTGVPFGNALFTTIDNVSGPQNQSAVYTFSSSSPAALNAGSSYWLVLGSLSDNYVGWNNNSTGNVNQTATDSYNGAFGSTGTRTTGAFSISGIAATGAPEPGSIALLGFGGFVPAALGAAKYRRQQHGKKA